MSGNTQISLIIRVERDSSLGFSAFVALVFLLMYVTIKAIIAGDAGFAIIIPILIVLIIVSFLVVTFRCMEFVRWQFLEMLQAKKEVE